MKNPNKKNKNSFVKGEAERIETIKQSIRDFVKTLPKREILYDKGI
jgi:hypothetical protein